MSRDNEIVEQFVRSESHVSIKHQCVRLDIFSMKPSSPLRCIPEQFKRYPVAMTLRSLLLVLLLIFFLKVHRSLTIAHCSIITPSYYIRLLSVPGNHSLDIIKISIDNLQNAEKSSLSTFLWGIDVTASRIFLSYYNVIY